MSDNEEELVDTPMKSGEDSSDSGSESEESEIVEWLATAREKRSTAGNRLTSLIQREAEDDELELLFAEDENDEGFEESGEDASDVQMDSSSDEEDQGPAAGDDDLEGEKELQKEARAAAKKRKRDDFIPKQFRKKVKIDPTAPVAPSATASRPKKKSERASWIPTAEDAPTRASLRGTTQKSKEQLHAQMLDRERKRLKQLANMEKAAREKAKDQPKEMTQAERLAEAARVEKRNAKSLNRWEEAEKVREEEQRAKLAALHNRKLEGPVITFWSGEAQWVGETLKRVGKHAIEEKREYKKRKDKEKEKELEAESAAKSKVEEASAPVPDPVPSSETPAAPQPPPTEGQPEQPPSTDESSSKDGGHDAENPAANQPASHAAAQEDVPLSEAPVVEVHFTDEQNLVAKDAIPEAHNASESKDDADKPAATSSTQEAEVEVMKPPIVVTTTNNQDEDHTLFKPATPGVAQDIQKAEESSSNHESESTSPTKEEVDSTTKRVEGEPLPSTSSPTDANGAPESSKSNKQPPTQTSQPPLNGNASLKETSHNIEQRLAHPTEVSPTQLVQEVESSQNLQPSNEASSQAAQSTLEAVSDPPAVPATPPKVSIETRNCLILENFDENAVKPKDVQTQILFGRKFPKAHKLPPHPVCVITGYPAKFRDPQTGLPYCNAYAYKEIHRLKRGDYVWSSLVQAYVGQGHYAARGVPSRFLQPRPT